MTKETCKVEQILWANTDNAWKPVVGKSFSSLEKAMEFVKELKSSTFAYMHQININHTIEGI